MLNYKKNSIDLFPVRIESLGDSFNRLFIILLWIFPGNHSNIYPISTLNNFELIVVVLYNIYNNVDVNSLYNKSHSNYIIFENKYEKFSVYKFPKLVFPPIFYLISTTKIAMRKKSK